MAKKAKAYIQNGFASLSNSAGDIVLSFYGKPSSNFYNAPDLSQARKSMPKSVTAALKRDARKVGNDMYKALDKVQN